MLNPRDPSDKNNKTLVLVGVGAIFVLLAGAWLLQGTPSKTASVPTGPLTGQAISGSGSTVVGAPVGTPPSQMSGQASAPSGSNTTGSIKP